MSIEAMKQALSALETVFMPHHPAVIKLRAAIEQAERQEPVAWMADNGTLINACTDPHLFTPLYTAPPQRQPLTTREVELLDGMIEVQLRHAKQCDGIGNRTMAEKQKGWDMERVALLQKLKAAHGIGGGE
jgi:hypothetical protein